MFIPLRPETLEAQGKPLATYALIAVWFVVHLLRAIGVPTLDWDAWGLVPGDLAPEALPTHIFLHASWAHLIGASLLLLLVGPALESRWGRGFYVAFVLLAAVAANGIYALVAPGLMRPLVGAAGGLTALLAACVLVYWRPGLHFTPLVKINGLPASLHLPAYVLPAAWLVCEIIASTGDHPVGMTRGTAYWGQLAGVAIGVASAWALRHWHLETGLPGACLDNERPASSTLVKALAAISAGRHELAFELLEQSARAHPDDADTITNLWETACACNKVGRAAPLVLLFVQQQITDGDEALALGLWCELVNKAPKLQAHPRALVELASGLARDGRKREAAWTLRCAAQQRTLLPGAAMRIASLAKGLHPSTGIAAARRALETPGLDQSKRSQIEQLIRELEEERRSAGEINLDATRDRAIDIELDESFAPPPQHAKAMREADANATSGFELSADGSLVEGDTGVDLAGEIPLAAPERAGPTPDLDGVALGAAAHGGRFHEVKLIEVVPIALNDDRIELEQLGGKRGLVRFQQIQALGVGAVHGLSAKPVILIDLVANWNDAGDGPLRVMRVRSDRFDVRRIMPEASGPMEAIRAMLAALLERSGAVPLPDRDAARGNPVRIFADLATYQREVLQIEG